MRRLFAHTVLIIAGTLVPGLKASDCSNGELRGAYSFLASGTVNGMPFATTGQTLYNGDGTAAGIIQASIGGALFGGPNSPPVPWTATYSLTTMQVGGGKTVCVLNKTITVPAWKLEISFFGTAGDDFRELRFITTTPTTTVSGTARKQ
jgi:hypothetical protein